MTTAREIAEHYVKHPEDALEPEFEIVARALIKAEEELERLGIDHAYLRRLAKETGNENDRLRITLRRMRSYLDPDHVLAQDIDRALAAPPTSDAAQDCPDCFGKGLENQDDRPGLLLGPIGEMECKTCRGTGKISSDAAQADE